MIQKLFTDQTVAVDIEVKSWEEAVRYGGAMLVDAGNTDKNYIDAMVQNIQKMGQYIVIAPGLAMPHARPEYGVKKIGMSLVRLKNPVPFGNEEYDPVDILIFICAIDQTTHITALAELMILIEDEPFLAAVRNGMTKNEIISYIQNKDFTVKDD
ncbi:PTS system IIA component, L-Asc family (TC 4.A.7) [Propionispira arboris]|uniref:PTS system IIA component, L-Asc family (TC 4.A.7) n=1 Tax=Propionispira arboris TaxID=84035 RepID=A0A1H6WUK6_9FIRM|nr:MULTISPECIES: PTS sugar transporter subunit IIA [Propionispira]SEJ19586.1 PTS system IIA component, L-Asc family (TC 4.A.7) [Propionispira arboris]